jgi:hypothetical protein
VASPDAFKLTLRPEQFIRLMSWKEAPVFQNGVSWHPRCTNISRTNTAKGRVERRWQDNFKVKQKGCFFYSNARIRFVSTWSNPRRTLPSTFRRAKQATSALNTDARIYLNVLFLGFLLGLALVRIPLIPLVFPLRGLDQVCR